jgi:chromate transporter
VNARPAPAGGPNRGSRPGRLREIGGAFLKLGLISFGGPVAHLGYFQREFVARRRWLDDVSYADLVALCQFLPGPASSQVAFGLGLGRGGIAGAVLASVCFMLPSAVAMTLFAYGIGSLGDLHRAGGLHGLKLAAVAVVALAVWRMGLGLCPDWPRRALAAAAAVVALAAPGPASQMGAIAGGGLLGLCLLHGARTVPAPSGGLSSRTRAWAVASLALFALLLAALPVLARSSGSESAAVFAGFYRAGSLVFGGGHVVLPLLRSAVVPPGWISDDAFLAGYGAVQAMPGPLFTFAAYLGTMIRQAPQAWIGGVVALLAIYLPGWLLVAGAYPFWHAIRTKAWAQTAIQGANAAVVGILLAALYRPVGTESVRGAWDVAAAVGAVLLLVLRVPPWAVVALMAALGQWVLR